MRHAMMSEPVPVLRRSHKKGAGLKPMQPRQKQLPPALVFVGLAEPPAVCPRERCGQSVVVHVPSDVDAPLTWSCVVGHGGVVSAPPILRQPPNMIPKGICQRCAKAPVPDKRRRGGFRGGYCDACIEEGRRLFAAGKED
jgi:hypothetical protein